MQTDEFSPSQETGTDRIKDAAGGVASEAGRMAESRASDTMTQIGDTLEQVAQAVRDAGSGIREQQPQVAGFVDTAAEQVERASSYLREHDAREALDSAQEFARRQPVAVVAGGLILGLAVGRLLRTAGTSTSGSSRSSEFGSYPLGGSGSSYGNGFGSNGGGSYGSAYGSAGLSDSAGTSTIASGATIDAGGAIDTGQASTPDVYTDSATIGRIDTEASTEDR